MSDLKELANSILGQVVTVSALLSGAGFLAVRAFVDGLGLPKHTALDAQGYLQYGGRFFFALLGQFLLVLAALLVLAILTGTLLRLIPKVRSWLLLPTVAAVGVLLVSLGAIYSEFQTLATPALFRTGTAVDLARADWPVWCADGLTAVAIIWIVEAGSLQATFVRQSAPRRLLALLSVASVLMATLLLPVSFGRTSMLPSCVEKVTFANAKGKVTTGLLVFSDTKAHFLWLDSLRLIEVARDEIKEISYEGRVDLPRSHP